MRPKGAAMVCADVQCIGTPVPRTSGWDRFWSGWRLGRCRGVIDVRRLPEHLQRDIGYLDGNDLAGQRE